MKRVISIVLFTVFSIVSFFSCDTCESPTEPSSPPPAAPGILTISGLPGGASVEIGIYTNTEDIPTQDALETVMEKSPAAVAAGSGSPFSLKVNENQTFRQTGIFLVVIKVNREEVRFKTGVSFTDGCAGLDYGSLRRKDDLPEGLIDKTLIITGFPGGTSVMINIYNYSGTIGQNTLESILAEGSIATTAGSGSMLELKTPDGQPFTQSGTFLVVITENGKQKFKDRVSFTNGGGAFNYDDLKTKDELPEKEGSNSAKYAEAFWGEWIRIDTGDTWYISGSKILVNGNSSSINPGLTKQSAQVIKASEAGRDPYYLFASRTANATLRGKVILMDDVSAGPSPSLARALSLGSMPPIFLKNPKQPEKPPIEVTPDPVTGEFEAPGFIPGDELEAEIELPDNAVSAIPVPPLPVPPEDTTAYVPPMVPIPVVSAGVNLKASIRPQYAEDSTLLYADGTSMNFLLEIENAGTEDCSAATFDLYYDSTLLKIDQPPSRGLGSIGPKEILKEKGMEYKKSIPLNITSIPFPAQEAVAFKDVEIGVKIIDTIAKKTWNDSVSIRYNKAKIPFRIGSKSPVQGIIKVPGGKTHHFKTNNASDGIYRYTVDLPWSTEDYFVIFSGASVNTESTYFLGINTSFPPQLQQDFITFDDYGRYEGDGTPSSHNNDEEHAFKIENRDSIMAYLHGGVTRDADIDYYRINLGNEVPVVKLVPMDRSDFKEDGGNKDGTVNPGESAYLDLVVKNETPQSRNVTVNLSVTGPNAGYVTIDKGNSSITSLSAGSYASLTNRGGSSSDNISMFTGDLSNALRFSLKESCPVDTTIPFTLSFTDVTTGVKWTETVELTITTRNRSIAIAGPAETNCVLSPTSGGDSHVNPGESFSYAITVKNSGANSVSGLNGVLTTTAASSYVSMTTSSAYIGALAADSSYTATFRFTVSSSCPPGTEIPFTLTLTSSGGTIWELTPPAVTVKAPVPGGLQVTATTAGSVSLRWSSVSGAAGYRVYYAASESGSYSVAGFTTDATTYAHTGLSAGTVYYYKVTAYGSAGNGGESERSAAVPAKTWANIVFNKAISGRVVQGIPDYYRFYISSGVSYAFTSNKAGAVLWENGGSWFSLSSSTTNQTPSSSGWALIKFENAGDYTLTVKSGEAAVSDFAIGSSSTKTINETNKTIAVLVPYGTNLASLTPTVTAASGWTCATTGAQNLNSPVEYRFTKDGAVQAYTVTVTRRGQGGITITPPGGDISIAGFPASSFTVSRTGSPRTITITDTSYTSYEWYVDDAQKTADSGSGGRTFTVRAVDYPIGAHTLTLIVYKNGVPYSNERRFTVTN
jgi:hypothetical protein